jgi:hypothetical protein
MPGIAVPPAKFVGCAIALGCAIAVGCASAPPPRDRLSPEQLKNGPSLYETGRFGTVPLSSGGLKVDEGAIERPAERRAAAAPTAQRHRGKRKARAQRSP